MMKFAGTVTKVAQTNDKHRYSIVEINNKVHLNYRLFIPGDELKLGQKVFVTVEVENPKVKSASVGDGK